MGSIEELVTYLAAQGIGTAGTDLFAGRMLDAPDAQVVVIETGGAGSVKAMASGPGQALAEQPGFQIIARGVPQDYVGPRDKAILAHRKLDGLGRTTMSGTVWHWVTAMQSPFFIQQDENLRDWIGFNILALKALSP